MARRKKDYDDYDDYDDLDDYDDYDEKRSGGLIAKIREHKVRAILIIVAAFLLVIGIVLGCALIATTCDGNFSIEKSGLDYYDTEKYKTNTSAGFSSKVIGTVERNKPVSEVKDERDAFPLTGIDTSNGVRYPKYGYTMSSVIGSEEEKQAARATLIEESDYLTAYGTRNNSGNGNNGDGSYNMMDADGYLYFVDNSGVKNAVNADGSKRRLYKHTAATGMYYGGINDANPDLSDDEPAIIKQLNIRPRGYGSYSVTGLYAPAGEVIKIQLSEDDMNATGGLTIHIGQALYNGQSNNIWVAKGQMQRFPNILNTMVVNKQTAKLENGVYTAYVGSFVGGPLYIRNTSAQFDVTISGCVAYSHFILGVTTEEEFEQNKKSTAPYFDLEVWNYGVLHSGPKFYSQKYSYEDLYKVAVLWDKVASVTTTNSNQGIVFLYDPFVAAGAAVAFPGRSSVNCPAGWMDGSLNYNGIVTSGSWGNFHEYHHNFQGYGVGNGGEVTNNGMTLVSYALFTKISAKRGIGSYGAQGLGGWNNYTSATLALEETLKIARSGESPSNGNQGLALYATLLHNYGADNYIQAKVKQQRGGYGQSYAGYFRAWEEQTHNDMTYFFKDVLCGLSADVAAQWHNKEYSSMFVPVASVYQTGRSYMYDGEKKYFKTMQPYVVPYENSFTLDLGKYSAPGGQYASGSIVIPEGFTYKIKSVVPAKGSVEKIDEFNYKYNFADKELRSGEIKVTLEITKDDKAFAVDDVELIVELERSHETNKMTLERTVYYYDESHMYSDAVEAYKADFANSTEKQTRDHTNPTQNCNTDIWLVMQQLADKFPNATQDQMMNTNNNTVHIIDGKLYFQEDGKYRIYLRGRKNCAVYFSIGGDTYELGAHVTNGSGADFYVKDAKSYFDVEYKEGAVTVTTYQTDAPKTYTYKLKLVNNEYENWLYTKEVLIIKSADSSYIGLGYGQWTAPLVTMTEKEINGVVQTVYTYNGKEYTEKDFQALNLPDLTPPTKASYINAYRRDYEFPNNAEFNADYFYKRQYTYNYTDNKTLGENAAVVEEQCANLNLHTGWGGNDLPVVLDGITNQGGALQLHTGGAVNANAPFTLVVDLGKVEKANRLIIFSQAGRADPCFPKNLNLYASVDGVNYTLVNSFTDLTFSGDRQTIDFDETEMRYYKIEVTAATSNHLIIRELQMWHTLEINGGTQLTPDDGSIEYNAGWRGTQVASTYGHVYVGVKGAKAEFEFTGKRVGILSSTAHGADFTVRIDGKKVDGIQLKEADGATYLSYLCDELKEGTHKVEVECNGTASIDSIVVFP